MHRMMKKYYLLVTVNLELLKRKLINNFKENYLSFLLS